MKTYKLRKIRSLAERFWAKVEVSNINKCWEWKGYKNPNGYGRISRGRKSDGDVIAHRLSWEIHYGVIPQGMNVCHHCDNPGCVNPCHLFLGTQNVNLSDCRKKGRARSGSMKGEANPKVKLSCSQVVKIRERYAKGNVFQYELAKEYRVTQANISAIITRKSWSHNESRTI